ncbi:hypothetical protein RUM44_004228 [Polyplax serrata]|uniref:Uncharacterized protein n=1 Tax=Polyplax serrata TaxID=468196 RepID=A0ABR1B278_POLSC
MRPDFSSWPPESVVSSSPIHPQVLVFFVLSFNEVAELQFRKDGKKLKNQHWSISDKRTGDVMKTYPRMEDASFQLRKEGYQCRHLSLTMRPPPMLIIFKLPKMVIV